jgi:hypothetical protein
MHRDHGTELVLGEQVTAFEGSGRVERVRTQSGRILERDFVVTGFGIQPNVELLERAGAQVDNGVGHHTVFDQLVFRGDTSRREFYAYYLLEGLVRAVGAMGYGDEIVPELEQQILKPLRP